MICKYILYHMLYVFDMMEMDMMYGGGGPDMMDDMYVYIISNI